MLMMSSAAKMSEDAEVINGYTVLKPFLAAGTAYWTIARKNGAEYFLKKFNTPKYTPSCADFCAEFEKKKSALYKKLDEIDNGNIAVIKDFFRYDTTYYIATEKINESSISAEHVYTLPWDVKLIIMRTLVNSMAQLEKAGIVHADLKPSNVMLKPTQNGFYALKLIDFDSSFFVDNPPENSEDLEGDLTYLSPEVLKNMCGENNKLSCKVDVFALGIMFHQFLCGEMPKYDKSKYDYLCEAVAEGADIHISSLIDNDFQELIRNMLQAEAEDRLSCEELFAALPTPAHNNDKHLQNYKGRSGDKNDVKPFDLASK